MNYLTAEKQLVEQLRSAHPDLHLQDIYARPEVASLYRAAWKDAPQEAREKIEAHHEWIGRPVKNMTASRFAFLCHYYEGGEDLLARNIAGAQETILELRQGQARYKQECEQREAEKQRRRQEASKRTPEEWAQYRADYRRRRMERAMRLLEEAMRSGVQLKHKGRCFFCTHPLTDPVSQLYGIGPDCRQSLVVTFGEPKSEAFFERIKLNTAGEVRK